MWRSPWGLPNEGSALSESHLDALNRRILDLEAQNDAAIERYSDAMKDLSHTQQELRHTKERLKDRENDVQVALAQTVAAQTRAQAAEERAVRCLAEGRLALNESYALSKVAAQALFGLDKSEVVNPPSVAEADRRAAVQARERSGR